MPDPERPRRSPAKSSQSAKSAKSTKSAKTSSASKAKKTTQPAQASKSAGAKSAKTTKGSSTARARGSAAKPKTTSKSAGSKSAGSKSAGSKSTSSRSKPKKQSEELQPLDLEGSDFEELLGSAVADFEAQSGVSNDDDADDADEADDANDDMYANLRPSARAPEAGAGLSAFAASASDPTQTGPMSPAAFTGEPLSTGVEADADDPTKPIDEILVAISSLALIVISVVLPWYRVGAREVTAFASGGFAVIPFMAGVVAFLVIVLRKLGVKFRFPVDTGLFLEGLGYLAVAGTIAARFIKPTSAVLPGVGMNSYFALAAGIGLSWFASRISHGAPLVVRPGWFREKGGPAGIAMIALLLVGTTAIAFMKPGSPKSASPGVGIETAGSPTSCFTEHNFPLPDALQWTGEAFYKAETPGIGGIHCGLSKYTSPVPISKLDIKMKKLLGESNWKFTAAGRPTAGTVTYTLESPLCGLMTVTDVRGNKVEHNSEGTIQIGTCAALSGGQ